MPPAFHELATQVNKNIENLHAIASKKERRIIGLMSGTSLDGLDIAVCRIEGSGLNSRLSIEHFETVSFTDEFREVLLSFCFRETVSQKDLLSLNKCIAYTHSGMILECLQKIDISPAECDLIASHGQTVFHLPDPARREPFGPATLQLGDGDMIATRTGIITVSDFRQKHIAQGGEGAPLAAYADLMLLSEPGSNIAALNIGGISNFSFIPAEGKMISSDIGPGNTLIDLACRKYFEGRRFDENGAIAASGKIDQEFLTAMLADDFFKRPMPRTTGPEYFSEDFLQKYLDTVPKLEPANIVATLTELTATTVARSLNEIANGEAFKLNLSGGGASNGHLVKSLQGKLKNARVADLSVKGFTADSKEAVLFALLANEAVAGDPKIFAERGLLGVNMGKISFPV